ncbi:MAG: hypothetical protein V3V78_03760 [Candidatus Woesearchaeota archaeon]
MKKRLEYREGTEAAGKCQENIVANFPGEMIVGDENSSIEYICNNPESARECQCARLTEVATYACHFPALKDFFIQYTNDHSDMTFKSLNAKFRDRSLEYLKRFAENYMAQKKEKKHDTKQTAVP